DNHGKQMTWDVTIEREGTDKPVCVAQSLSRSYP
ncbi:MAG: MaoC family dehydratase, partial [Burkholderiaceae bacterium]